MSKTEQADIEIPKQVTVSITDDGRKEQWLNLKRELADRWDTTVDSVSHRDVARELLDSYLPLRDDKRVEETIEAIASDHNVEPSDVTLECAFKTAAGAYVGFQQTSDWDLSENGNEP